MMDWSRAGSWRAENLASTILHMDPEIQALFLAYPAFGFGISLCKAAKNLSSIVGVVGGQRGICVRLPRYLSCLLRGALRRQTVTM